MIDLLSILNPPFSILLSYFYNLVEYPSKTFSQKKDFKRSVHLGIEEKLK